MAVISRHGQMLQDGINEIHTFYLIKINSYFFLLQSYVLDDLSLISSDLHENVIPHFLIKSK